MNPEALAYAIDRGLSEETLTRMNVTAGNANFGNKENPNTHLALVFQYQDVNHEIVNYKARATDEKLFKAKAAGKQIAYNWGPVARALESGAQQAVYITEAEFDACSLVEAGFSSDACLSVASGAPRGAKEGGELGGRYAFWLEAVRGPLKDAERYVLCSDNDDPGRALRADLVSILGAAKCWFVDWPEGCKDANDYLVRYGPIDLRDYVDRNAKPWPVRGLYRMSEIPEPPALELWDTGFEEFGGSIKLAPTMLSAVTGWPGSGKTHLMQQLWFQVCKEHDIRIVMMSAETGIKPHVRRNLRQFFWHKAERDLGTAQIAKADTWIDEHILLLDSGGEQPTVKWLINTIEVAAIRHGCRAAIIDPWNKVEEDFDSRGDSETRWIGRTLDLFIAMSRGLNIHTQIIAHPSKPDGHAKNYAPDLYSISGSAHWNNRVDQGFCIYREKLFEEGKRMTGCELRVLKTRFEELGHPRMFQMDFDPKRGIFKSMLFAPKFERAMGYSTHES